MYRLFSNPCVMRGLGRYLSRPLGLLINKTCSYTLPTDLASLSLSIQNEGQVGREPNLCPLHFVPPPKVHNI